MRREWALFLAGGGLNVIVALLQIAPLTIPSWAILAGYIVGTLMIIGGLVSALWPRRKVPEQEPQPPVTVSAPTSQAAQTAGGTTNQAQGDVINYHYNLNAPSNPAEPTPPTFPVPVILSEPDRAVSELIWHLERGAQLQEELTPSGIHQTGWAQYEYWSQQWLDRVQRAAWRYLPDQATYIMYDNATQVRQELQQYTGWQTELAVRRVYFDRRLTRLRQVCSQIPELRKADSPTSEVEGG